MEKWYQRLNPFRRDKIKTLEAITGFKFSGKNSLAGTNITPDSALTISAVWAAVDIISNNIATIEFEVVEKLPGGGRASAFKHPAYDLINGDANADHSNFHFKKLLMVHALLYDNGGWAEIVRFDGITPTALIPLNPMTTKYETKEGVRMVVTQDNAKDPKRWLNPANVIHVYGMSINGIDSLGLIKNARESLGLTMACDDFSAAFFGNGAWMGGFIETTAALSEKSQKQLLESVNEMSQGADKSHKMTVLPYGTKLNQNVVDLKRCNLNEIREYQVIEVCRFFNIQPTKLFDYSNGTMANFEQANIEHYSTTLLPWVVNIEGEFTRKMIPAFERKIYVVKHNMTLSTLKGDPSTIADICTKLVGGPIMTPNEGRAILGLNPVEGGNALLTPVNMQSLQAGSPDTEPSFNNAIDVTVTPPKALEAPKSDNSKFLASARSVAVETFGRLQRREVAAIKRAAQKPTHLLEWIDGFYREHESFAVHTCESSCRLLSDVVGKEINAVEIARNWAADSRAELESLIKTVEPDDLGEAVERLCERWESKPKELVEILIGEGK